MSHFIMYEALDIETIWIRNIAKPICIAITDNDTINFYRVDVCDVNKTKLIEFMLLKCRNDKIYYVHNLTFEMYVFIEYLHILNVKFNIISSDKIIYSAEIYYKKKK